MGYAAAEKLQIVRLVEQSSLAATARSDPDQSQHPRAYELTSTRRPPAINLPLMVATRCGTIIVRCACYSVRVNN